MEKRLKKLLKQAYDEGAAYALKGSETYSFDNFLKYKEEQLRLCGVSGRIEQFVCLCPRNEKDNCDRKEPCKECETCPHLRQTNCH